MSNIYDTRVTLLQSKFPGIRNSIENPWKSQLGTAMNCRLEVQVHGDYTPQSAHEIFEWQLRAVPHKELAAYRNGHFLLINAWRNLNPEPVENDHLAVCA